jgi:hypothetical protein
MSLRRPTAVVQWQPVLVKGMSLHVAAVLLCC